MSGPYKIRAREKAERKILNYYRSPQNIDLIFFSMDE